MSRQDGDDLVLYEASEGVALVTFNRPERLNAWTPQMGDRYFELLDRAANDPDVRVVVLTGAGQGFCAGADMDLLETVSEEQKGAAKGLHHPIETITIPKPVIAAINGAAIGIGLIFALMCDVRFAATGAKFGTGFSRIGLVAEDAISWTLQHAIGQPAALELLLSGRIFLGDEAKELGIVSKVMARDELVSFALTYARDLAQNCSPLAMALIKQQVYLDADRSFEEALRESRRITNRVVELDDFKEGLAAYAEKRAPRFRGIARSEVDELLGG